MVELNIPLGFSETPINVDRFNSMYSSRHKVHLITGKQHRLAGRSSIKLAELRNDKIIIINNHMHPQDIIMKLCIHEDIKPAMVLGPSDYNLVNELCATNRVVGFWAGPMDLVSDLVNVSVDDFNSLYWEFHFIANQSVHLNNAAHKFIAYTKEILFPDETSKI
jgi:hypothetical protein